MSTSLRVRSASAYAVATVACLAACAALDAGVLLFIVRHSVDRALMPPIWLQLHFLLRAATACAFLTWFDRLYSNLVAIRGETAYARWWAIAGFFVPPFALFRPCELALELWRSSRTDRQPILVYLWWATFLQMTVLFMLSRPIYYFATSIVAAGFAMALVPVLTAHVDEAQLEMQREERQLLRERRTATALQAPAPAVAPAPGRPGLAPHLAAIEQAAAQRAAERRGVPPPAPPPDPAALPCIAADLHEMTPPAPVVPQPATSELRVESPSIPDPPFAPPLPSAPAAPPTIVLPIRHKPPLDVDVLSVRIAAAALATTGVLAMFIAARTAFVDAAAPHPRSIVYAGAGVVLAAMAAFVGRQVPESREHGWGLSAIAATAVALANVVAATWFVLP